MKDYTHDDTGWSRRRLLTALAGASGVVLAGCFGDATGSPTESMTDTPTGQQTETPTTSRSGGDPPYHPGPPRFTGFGEAPDPPELAGVRGNFAPWNPDPDATYDWSVADQPEGARESVDDDVVQFRPSYAGDYRLRLDGPAEPADLSVRVFERTAGLGPRPRVTLRTRVDGDRAVLEADARAPLSGDTTDGDIAVEFHTDDRDPLPADALAVDGHTASVPLSALDGPTRIHAVAVGETYSAADYVRIDPDDPGVARPNDPPDWLADAVIYEIFVRAFDEHVTFDRLVDRLDYLDDLGVEAVWLTPILEAHSHRNPDVTGGPHGYDVVDYFETAAALGSMDAFDRFVDACHDRGIRVLFDLVVNHCAREHPFFRSAATDPDSPYRDWFVWEDDGDAVYYSGWHGIPIFDYDSLAVRAFVLDVVDFWADRVDGFRCDVAWGVPHSFWKEVRARVKADHPEFALLDEAFPSTTDYHEAEFDVHYGDALFGALRKAGRYEDASYVRDALVERLDRGFPEHALLMQYVENHDVDRYLNDVGRRSAQQTAALSTFTLPGGPPMLYYGQETGLTGMREEMNWKDPDEDLRSFYRDLVALRQSAPALESAAGIEHVEVAPDERGVLAYERDAEGQRLLVVLQFAAGTTTITLPADADSLDLVTGVDLATGDPRSVAVDWGAVFARS